MPPFIFMKILSILILVFLSCANKTHSIKTTDSIFVTLNSNFGFGVIPENDPYGTSIEISTSGAYTTSSRYRNRTDTKKKSGNLSDSQIQDLRKLVKIIENWPENLPENQRMLRQPSPSIKISTNSKDTYITFSQDKSMYPKNFMTWEKELRQLFKSLNINSL